MAPIGYDEDTIHATEIKSNACLFSAAVWRLRSEQLCTDVHSAAVFRILLLKSVILTNTPGAFRQEFSPDCHESSSSLHVNVYTQAMTKENPESQNWNADAVRDLRSRMGLTQRQMARRLGVRQQTVSEWETGLYAPRGASVTILRMVSEESGPAYNTDRGKGVQEDEDSK